MWLLLSAVVTASLLGSLHCVGMCGPLALWAAGADRHAGSRLWLPTALYHLGRWATYALVGAIAGGLGRLLDWTGSTTGVQLLAARVVGLAMVIVGLVALWRLIQPLLSLRVRKWRESSKNPASTLASGATENAFAPAKLQPPQPGILMSLFIKARPAVFQLPLPLRGLSVGLLTPLLPCGWLYLFALLATATGSMLLGALVMSAFWLGSVPLLVGLVAGTQLLRGRINRLVPWLASFLLVLAGTYTASGRGFAELNQRLQVSSILLERLNDGSSIADIDQREVEQGVQELISTPLPCCQNRLQKSSSSSEIQAADVAPDTNSQTAP